MIHEITNQSADDRAAGRRITVDCECGFSDLPELVIAHGIWFEEVLPGFERLERMLNIPQNN